MKKVYVFLAEGFEEMEAVTPIDLLRRAGVDAKLVSVTGNRAVTGAHGVTYLADLLFEEIEEDADMLVLPGGLPGTTNLQAHEGLTKLLLKQHEAHKWVAAICAAPMVLGALGIVKDRHATIYPGIEDKLIGAAPLTDEVVVDGKRDKARILGLPLGEAEYYLAQNLKRGYHTVEVTKRTESQFNAVYFNSITYTGRLEKASGKNRKIEFIGDSITCGQGYEVRGQITNYQRSEDGINNYTGQTARALNAEYNVVGLSGWGAFGGGGSDQNRMGRVYEKASYRRKEAANWNFDSWQPDLVVINLGTNDYNYRVEGNAMTPTDYKTEVKN